VSPEQALLAAVGAVREPELALPLAELGLLRAVTVGRRGRVTVQIVLTSASSPVADELRAAVVAAASGVPGVSRVEVSFGALTERERLELSTRLRAARTTDPVTGRYAPAPRIYAVASGKGGVGKSSVTANLAAALALSGQRVGLMDADVWGYSIPQLFGVRRSPSALKGLMLPVEAHGVRLMSTGFFVNDEEPVIWRGPMLHKALEQFVDDVHWGALDVLLLDLPPGTGDVTLSLLEFLPTVSLLLVTTPQPAAQTVAARVGRMARDMRVPVAGVVENMSTLACAHCGGQTALFGSGGGARLAEQLAAPLLATVPLDLALREAGDAGVPVVVASPGSIAAQALSQLAVSLPRPRRSLAGVPLQLTVVPSSG